MRVLVGPFHHFLKCFYKNILSGFYGFLKKHFCGLKENLLQKSEIRVNLNSYKNLFFKLPYNFKVHEMKKHRFKT